MKRRLDTELTARGLVPTRSQAESWVRLGKVTVDGEVITKPGHFVGENSVVRLAAGEQYVSRAGLKLAGVAELLGLDFRGKVVLDVGSSTGGFTDYALRRGAAKVIAVDVGTDQLHPSLRGEPRVELYEKTDIRQVVSAAARPSFSLAASGPAVVLAEVPDIVVIDVSFISLRDVLPHIAGALAGKSTEVVAMVKPQFEAGPRQVSKGVIKNDALRRQILADFEAWARRYFVIADKRDSSVAGAKGNKERFYKLLPLA